MLRLLLVCAAAAGVALAGAAPASAGPGLGPFDYLVQCEQVRAGIFDGELLACVRIGEYWFIR
ncbi:hypothetical protein [Nocardia asteroides]|uniref:hypothetical protein n=1 Tax=Nocardia asteroides TaxID=1824 RepID=UPI001E37B620|nr:hypothetical protein [Nocardia asteroides]UGT61799.1 hypothetical protein LTT61_00110 [Nocardia asteroides]